MQVSYVELFIHCKKVFRACGIPYGCADDGADVVTWSEFIGLDGMKILKTEIPNMNPPGMDEVKLLEEKDGLFRLDGNGMSAIILGKLMADFALAMAETEETVRVHMKNTTKSYLLARPAHYIASRGKGCIVHYKMVDGNTMWILATPEIAYPLFAEGAGADEILQRNITDKLGKYENTNMGNDEFWLVCTTEIELITSCVRKLRQEAKNGTMKLTESLQLKAKFDKAYNNGAKINMNLWEDLDSIGRHTLIESTEESRLRGAGEHAP